MDYKSGIYRIRNQVNGHLYIGSAVNFGRRWTLHKNKLKSGIHRSKHLQNAWNKYGSDSFVFEKLLVCSPENLLMYEQQFIDFYKPVYNMTKTAGSLLGFKMTPETIVKMTESRRKRAPYSAESRAKISASLKGKSPSQETRLKMSIAQTGRKASQETIAKRTLSLRGKIRTPEVKQKLSKIVKNWWATADTSKARQAMSVAQTKRWAKIKAEKALTIAQTPSNVT